MRQASALESFASLLYKSHLCQEETGLIWNYSHTCRLRLGLWRCVLYLRLLLRRRRLVLGRLRHVGGLLHALRAVCGLCRSLAGSCEGLHTRLTRAGLAYQAKHLAVSCTNLQAMFCCPAMQSFPKHLQAGKTPDSMINLRPQAFFAHVKPFRSASGDAVVI